MRSCFGADLALERRSDAGITTERKSRSGPKQQADGMRDIYNYYSIGLI